MRKSYLYTLISLLIIGLVVTAVHFTPIGTSIENSVIGHVNPDEVVNIYWDNLKEFESSSRDIIFGRNKYVSTHMPYSFPEDGILLAWTPESIAKAQENYTHSELYGRIPVYAWIKTSNAKNADAELTYSTSSGNIYHDIDISEVFWAIYTSSTWHDIGYNSLENIELWIPSDKDPFYPVYLTEIYCGVKNYIDTRHPFSESETLVDSDIWDIVENILDKANYIQGTNLPKTNKNTIILSIEDIGADYLCNFAMSAGVPVYAFWSEDVYGDFIRNAKNLAVITDMLDVNGKHKSHENNRKKYQEFYNDCEDVLSIVSEYLSSPKN